MKINKENTYLFLKGNKNKLVFNPPDDVITTDFTLMMRFTPDKDYYLEGMKKEPFFTQGLFSKNGKHIGLFFTAGRDEINNILLKVSFEWWKKTDNPDVDEVKSIDFYPSVEEVEKGLDVVVIKNKNSIELIVNGKTKTAEMKDVIDYSYSYTWVGCANRLSPEYQHIFEGDINLLHLQEKVLDSDNINLFFNDYDKFIKEVSQNMNNTIMFTSNFQEVSPYKVKDHSYNNNHLIKFSKQWLN
jgi:hypothetical protein|tara:strand:- start:166 stop:894 length:729 start_codon:yes stop_codon:yes gene_type:complete